MMEQYVFVASEAVRRGGELLDREYGTIRFYQAQLVRTCRNLRIDRERARLSVTRMPAGVLRVLLQGGSALELDAVLRDLQPFISGALRLEVHRADGPVGSAD